MRKDCFVSGKEGEQELAGCRGQHNDHTLVRAGITQHTTFACVFCGNER